MSMKTKDRRRKRWVAWTSALPAKAFERRADSLACGSEARFAKSKLNERTGNVIENKGSVLKTRQRIGNVYEKTRLTINFGECY